VHIEARGLGGTSSDVVARDLEDRLQRVAGVERAEANAILGRVVISFAETNDAAGTDVGGTDVGGTDVGGTPDVGPDIADLLAVIEDLEKEHRLTDQRFADRPEHPADIETSRREVVALGADLAGIGVSVAGRLLRLARFPVEVAALVPLVESTPRLRRTVDSVLGPPLAEMSLALANATAQGLAQGPLGLVVDAACRLSLLGEATARRHVWAQREPGRSGRDRRRRLRVAGQSQRQTGRVHARGGDAEGGPADP
jgi:cation-transporting ATPase I